ncbi:MAG: hypothetical protein J0I12_27945 [Candidatus Eremiobacteraeota bacterium]|nr:hypothetical protein [Candidatus Eremiobacteraeota bacterium]
MMTYETWVYEDVLEDGQELEPPDETQAADSLIDGVTIEHAADAAIRREFLNREELVDPLDPADLVRDYAVALREQGSGQAFRVFRATVRVVVAVGPLEELASG